MATIGTSDDAAAPDAAATSATASTANGDTPTQPPLHAAAVDAAAAAAAHEASSSQFQDLELNDAELADIVSAISPDLSALLNDEALDAFLNTSVDEALDGDAAAAAGTKEVDNGDSDDSVGSEVGRLAAAENSLREELDMVGGLGAIMASPATTGEGGEGGDEEESAGTRNAASSSSSLPSSPQQKQWMQNQQQTQGGNDKAAAAAQSLPLSPTRPVQYTYAAHAAHLSIRTLPADLGRISVPLLSRQDVQEMFPPFNPEDNFDPTTLGGDLMGDLEAEAIDNGYGSGQDDDGTGQSIGIDDNGEDPSSGIARAYEELINPKFIHVASTTNGSQEGDAESVTLAEAEAEADAEEAGPDADIREKEHQEIIGTTQDCFREYISPIEPPQLRTMFAGLVEPIDAEGRTMAFIKEVGGEATPGASADNRPARNGANADTSTSRCERDPSAAPRGTVRSNRPANAEPIPPVRTVTLRVRPDVLCGAVMDAISSAATAIGGEITKRRGGHLRCSIPGFWLGRGTRSRQTSTNELDGISFGRFDGAATTPVNMATPTPRGGGDVQKLSSSFSQLLSPFSSSKVRENQQQRKGAILLPPTTVDVQLVTRKLTRECERLLLIRFYRSDATSDHLDYVSVDVDSMGLELSHHGMSNCPLDEWGGVLLREAGSLVQKMKRHDNASFGEINPQGRNVPISASVVRETIGVSLPPTPSDIEDDFPPVSTRGKPVTAGGTGYIKAFGSMITSPFRSPETTSRSTGTKQYLSRNHNRGQSIRWAPSAGVYPDEQSAMEAASVFLRQHFEPCQSVVQVAEKGDGAEETIPCLCLDDYSYIHSSWRFIQEILSELDSRTLSYPTLSSYSFGSFPSLPTLDVHYCSQLRLVSRENMILSLLKMASELEGFARESEYSCANLIQILRVTYGEYQMGEPALPKPLPLSAYPLDYEPAESVCPPWGQFVMEALNQVAASSSPSSTGGKAEECTQPGTDTVRSTPSTDSGNQKNFKEARDAVALISSAFMRQADEEQSARIARKNVQVMDRLAKMQAHKRLSVLVLQSAYGKYTEATKAANDLNRRVEKYGRKLEDKEEADEIADPSLLSFYTPVDRVPLLKCGIAIGATASGICYVTANEVVCITQVIPLLGGKNFVSVPIAHVEISVNEVSASLMNPLASDSVTIHDLRSPQDGGNAEDFTFTPALVAKRFKAFVDVVRDVATEDPDTLKFSVRGGLVYAQNDTSHKEPVLLSRPEKQRAVKSEYASMLDNY